MRADGVASQRLSADTAPRPRSGFLRRTCWLMRGQAIAAAATNRVVEIVARALPPAVFLVAGRELRLLRRRRAVRGALALLAGVAWLPPLILPLRAGSLGLATFEESVLLTVALGAIVLPLLALLAGADLLAGEIEDRTLVPVITLPISRGACFAGKVLGRAGLLCASYLAGFGSVAIAITAWRGATGWQDYSAVAVSGLLLCLTCGGIGTALGASAGGRVRAFGVALVVWLVMVFAIDAVLLAAVIVLAPPPPQQIGMHGHSELAAPRQEMPIHDHGAHGASAQSQPAAGNAAVWLMTLDPPDLFRVSAFAWGPTLHARLTVGLPADDSFSTSIPLVIGWLVWLSVPPLVALWRFRRVVLR